MKLTVKKKDGAIKKGAKIGAAIGGTTGAISGAAGGRLAASMMGLKSNKAKIASTIGGAVVGGATRAAVGGALGAGIGAGVKAVKNRKKKGSFSNTELTEFKDFTVNAGFPSTEIKTEKTKSIVELAYEKIRNKEKLPNQL